MADTKPKPAARENRAEDVQAQRRRRDDTGIAANLRFSVPDHLRDDETYRYHWLVDRPGRIESKTKHDDWDFVEETELVADGRQTGAGTRIERHAGTDSFGNPLRAYLVRKLRVHDEEDKKKARQRVDERMAAIQRGRQTDETGRPSDGSYVPAGGIVIQENYKP